MSGNRVAPAGQVWVCGACGKRSRDRYGEHPISRGWDEACMLNAVLCLESSLEFDNAGRLVCAEAVNESAP
jgi:hypothetical protein